VKDNLCPDGDTKPSSEAVFCSHRKDEFTGVDRLLAWGKILLGGSIFVFYFLWDEWWFSQDPIEGLIAMGMGGVFFLKGVCDIQRVSRQVKGWLQAVMAGFLTWQSIYRISKGTGGWLEYAWLGFIGILLLLCSLSEKQITGLT